MKNYIVLFALVGVILTSCGTHKVATSTSDTAKIEKTSDTRREKMNYLHKVYDNAVYATNIVSKIDLTLGMMGRDVSVDGKLQMRKNEVVRITVSPFGLMEVGRLEFTPDYVLIVDRMNKQYAKATYNDLDFLKDNGLNFYSLQALFWNELFVPGEKRVNETLLDKFDVNLSAPQKTVLMNSGNISFSWSTDASNAHIVAANVEYGKGTSNSSSAKWQYDKFVDLGKKQFPTSQTLSFQSRQVTNGAALSMKISMKKITTEADWDAKTDVSGKYTQIGAEEILGKLMSL